ncbi:hypothetical protein ACIPSH_22720 [Streptomyces iakyrus]|uniref:hypothetical protein n=1 Tax=Streptomyces iakyrus TaxID=68219 RepID=UPI0037F3C000
MGGLRDVAAPFVAPGPSGVAVRDRLQHLTPEDEHVLRLVGAHLGSLASKDLKARCMDGLDHSADTWAARKRELTASSSSRWAGSITKATHDQWALARRGQAAHGAQHWQQPLSTPTRKTSRHEAASIAIGRRAQGHPIRRRTAPPCAHQSDVHGHRTVQARPETLGREGPRPRIPGPRTRSVPPYAGRTRATRTSTTVRGARSDQEWVQHPLLLTEEER